MYRGTNRRQALSFFALLLPFSFLAGCLQELPGGEMASDEDPPVILRDVGGDAASAPADAASVPEATVLPMDTGPAPPDGTPREGGAAPCKPGTAAPAGAEVRAAPSGAARRARRLRSSRQLFFNPDPPRPRDGTPNLGKNMV